MIKLYDRADIYDLLENEHRYQIVKKHWQTILNGKDIHSLLDVSIGSGNTTLPILDLGISLWGSDLSGAMLERCRKKAEERGYQPDLRVCDFRKLSEQFGEHFDCVASTGNSLGYVTNRGVLNVLEQMNALVRPGGYLYFDLRNWDKIVKTQQRFYTYDPAFDGDTRINLVQVWDHHLDGSMDFNLLYTFEKQNHIVQKEHFVEHYFPVGQKLLLDKLRDMGYQTPQISMHPAQFGPFTERCDWYCVIAQKPFDR